MLEFDNFTDCYIALVNKVYNSPEYTSSPRGMNVKEVLGCTFKIKDPRSRIPFVAPREFSTQYMIAELLWYLSGDNSTSWISNYSSFWKKISDDGSTANSAYGARIFCPHDRIAGGKLTQWDYIKGELTSDPDSRRAVIHIRSPWDSIYAKLDVPCTLTLQFFIRDEKLHMISNMRSSDLILGIAYDIPAFTFFQEMLAFELNVGLGEYIHMSNSLHIYERHFSMAKAILTPTAISQAKMQQISRGMMPPMESAPPVESMYSFEKQLRLDSNIEEIMESLNEFSSMSSGGDNYWNDWAKILCSHRMKKVGLLKESKNMINSTAYVGYHLMGDF